MRLHLLSCEIFFREVCTAAARSPHRIDLTFLPKGLHDLGCEPMQARLADALADIDQANYDAVLLGYGLCNNGLLGLEAGPVPLVVPRAHDCITVFLGSKERYAEYFTANPGTYFLTSGWLERNDNAGELKQLSIQHQTGMDLAYQEMVDKYGEDNAKYLYDTLVETSTANYGKYAFIEMGVEPDDSFEKKARADAEKRGWEFDKIAGDMSLVTKLVDGQWNEEDFLVVPPGHRIAASSDDAVVTAEPTAEKTP